MSIFYVSPTGSNTAPYDTWAKATTSINTAFGATTSADDIIEIDGGAAGITYAERVLTHTGGTAGITIKGSSASGHDGEVIINGNGGSDCLYTGQNMTFQKLTFANSDTSKKSITGQGTPTITFTDCKFDNSTSVAFIGGTITVLRCIVSRMLSVTNGIAGSGTVTFEYCKFEDNDSYIYLDSTDNFIFYNCLFVGFRGYTIYQNSVTSVLTAKNCVFMVGDNDGISRDTINSASGTSTVENCLLLPSSINAGSKSWTGITPTNCIYTSPLFTHSRRDGVIVIIMDDSTSIDMFDTISTYAMSTYGMAMTIAVDKTDTLTASQITKLNTAVANGHSVASHTRTHPNLTSLTNGIAIQYTGAGANCLMTISSYHLTTTIGGVADQDIDLTTYHDMSSLATYINGLADYTCTLVGDGDLEGQILADVADRDIKTASYQTLQDDERFFDWEMTGSKDDLEAAIPGYTVIGLVPPGNATDATVQAALKARSYLSGTGTTLSFFETGIPIYTIHRRPYSYFDNTTETTIRNGVTAWAEWVKWNGTVDILYVHYNEWTEDQWHYALDELYNSGVTVLNYDDAISYIMTEGTDGGSDTWSKTGGYTDESNYYPFASSPLVDAGQDVGLSTDYALHGIDDYPDIGLYELLGSFTVTMSDAGVGDISMTDALVGDVSIGDSY